MSPCSTLTCNKLRASTRRYSLTKQHARSCSAKSVPCCIFFKEGSRLGSLGTALDAEWKNCRLRLP
jgi:hypothetical protein